MKKYILLIACLCIGHWANTQNLDRYISKNAMAVVEVSSDQIFDLVSITDLENMLPPDPNGNPMDLNQFGIDLDSKAYYFYEKVDSIGYQNVIVALADMNKAEAFVGQAFPNPPSDVNGYKFVSNENMAAAWNDRMMILTYADIPKVVYTMEDLIAQKESEQYEEQDDEPVFEPADEEEENEIDDDEPVFEPVDEEEEYEVEDLGYQLEGDMSYENLEFELMMKNLSAPFIYDVQQIESKLTDRFSSIVNNPASNAVSSLSSFKDARRSDASVYYWVNSLDQLMGAAMGGLDELLPYKMDMGAAYQGLNAMAGNLVFGKDEILLNTSMSMDESMASSWGKMYNSDIDKAFLKYFDHKDVLSYLSYSMDMGSVLKEYPAMLSKMYGGMLPDFKEEMEIGMEVISVILDEDAIGEMITGDILLMLHDIDEHEVTYTTYEYDEDFNATEVEGVRMEPLPLFTAMIGSQNQSIIKKLLRLAKKYEISEQDRGAQKIMTKAMGAPFDLYFVHNDGIAFLTNSRERVENYRLGKKICDLGDQKKSLKNNVFNMYADLSSLMGEFSTMMPMDENTLKYMQDNFRHMSFSSSKMKGNSMESELILKTSGERENSLKLILEAFQIMQGNAY